MIDLILTLIDIMISPRWWITFLIGIVVGLVLISQTDIIIVKIFGWIIIIGGFIVGTYWEMRSHGKYFGRDVFKK
jgi:uncharacterized membrane protein YgcG